MSFDSLKPTLNTSVVSLLVTLAKHFFSLSSVLIFVYVILRATTMWFTKDRKQTYILQNLNSKVTDQNELILLSTIFINFLCLT